MNNPNITLLKQTIILDTNIIQYSTNKKFGKEVTNFLNELVKRGFELAISEISLSELVANLSGEKEREALNLLKSFKSLFVDRSVLHATARISSIYNLQRKLDQKSKSEASTEDKIIAATAILNGSLIITSNINDFPRPFFNEVEEELIHYKEGNKTNMIVIQLLKPNIPVINQRFSEMPKK